MKIKVGVIFGGPTVEHEISIISAVQAMKNIDDNKYDIVPIYIDKERNWYTGHVLRDIETYKNLEDLKRFSKNITLVKKEDEFHLQSLGFFKRTVSTIDVAFPIVHGNSIEDGTLAGYLETVGVPYVGSGVLGAAVGQDKVIMKQIMKSCNLPIVDYTWFYDVEYDMYANDIKKDIKKIGYPVIVKPATLGSSIGIVFVKDEKDLDEAIYEAMQYDKKIIVEKAINNLKEVNCSVLGNYEFQELSVIEEVISADLFLTFKDKYVSGSKKTGKGVSKVGGEGIVATDRIIPARIENVTEEEIKDISKRTFKALNLSGLCRIDFLIDGKTNKVYVNEPNTIPGSLSFYLWEPAGKKYPVLLDDMINLAIRDFKIKNKKVKTFDNNVLSSFNGTKGIKGSKKF